MLSNKKTTIYDIPLAINLSNDKIVWYINQDNDDNSSDCESEKDYIEDKEILIIDELLNDYNSIKYRKPYYKKYLEIKKQQQIKEFKKMKGDDLFVLPLDNKFEEQIQNIVIFGMSGSGKSYWASIYIQLYHSKYPNRKIYLFSRKNYDKLYDDIPYISRIKLDEKFMDAKLDLEVLPPSLLIFDDVDQCEKDIKEKIILLRNQVSELGRSQGIFTLNIIHNPLTGSNSTVLKNEMTAVVLFPQSTSHFSIELLKTYMGLSKENIDTILASKQRWVYITKCAPRFYLTSKKLQLL